MTIGKHIKREQFIWEFQNFETIPSCFQELKIGTTTYTNPKAITNKASVVYVSLVPTYLNTTLTNANEYHKKTIHHTGKNGVGIVFDGSFKSVDEYLKKTNKRKLRDNLKRAKKRLETSFNIRYEVIFGSITNEKYTYLLSECQRMLEARFKEKNIENMFLKEWEWHTKALFNLINTKKASIFIIYSDDKPINISINTNLKNGILMAKANAFDTDYSKFSLGHIDIFLHVEWCIKNNYQFLDLGFGVLDYKAKWCNVFYDFEYHLYRKKQNALAAVIATMEAIKIHIKNTIKTYSKRFKKYLKPASLQADIPLNNPINLLETDTALVGDDAKEIDLNNPNYAFLRQHVYDYLYHTKQHIKTIKVYQNPNKANSYIVKVTDNLVKHKTLIT